MFLTFGQTQQLHTMLQSVVYHSSTVSTTRDLTNAKLHHTRNNSLITVKNLVSKLLEGWWIRSQSSFHRGAGITFFDPSAGEEVDYRFSSSQGVNVWDKGQVTLLKKVDAGYETTTSSQKLRSIRYSDTDAVLSLDGHDVNKLLGDGTVVNFIDYDSGTEDPVYAICDDGTTAYWVTNAD
jgi:hypothetical protein